jgi:hypothetical protein
MFRERSNDPAQTRRVITGRAVRKRLSKAGDDNIRIFHTQAIHPISARG